MSVEQNKANVRRLIEAVFSKGNWSILPELIAPNYIYHIPGNELKGPEGLKQYFTMFRNAFPDLHATIDHIVAEGDMVAFFGTMSGTFKGELMGAAPTGKSLKLPACVLSRHEGVKQAEAWPYIDMLSLYHQLGIPVPPG